MTEAELLDTAQTIWGIYMSVMSVFISVVSAYLIIAYIAGDQLTRAQVMLVNVLMGIFSAFAIAAMHGFSVTATELIQLALDMSSQRTSIGITTVPIITLIVFPSLVLASYKFMWNVRHP